MVVRRRWNTILSCPHPNPRTRCKPEASCPSAASRELTLPWVRPARGPWGAPLTPPALSSQTFIFTDGDDPELQLQGGERPLPGQRAPGPPLPTPLIPVPYIACGGWASQPLRVISW